MPADSKLHDSAREDPDRRTAIADAAVAIISERGIRALTHRAIDQRLSLPLGSTSYYVRTRRALLETVVNRLAEGTGAAIGEAESGTGRTLTAGLSSELDAWSHRMGGLLDRMVGDRSAQTLARYALTLELATEPELHRLLIAGRPIRAIAESKLRELGATDPAAQAADLVSFADGLVFDRLAGTRSLNGPRPGSTDSVAELSRAMRTVLRGIFGV